MKTCLRCIGVAAMAAIQLWPAGMPQPVVVLVDALMRQASRAEALASTAMRIDFIARCLRRMS